MKTVVWLAVDVIACWLAVDVKSWSLLVIVKLWVELVELAVVGSGWLVVVGLSRCES